ncbi:MAG TPA: DUF1992 domain-containing protein [Acidimicrobiia bacterium]|nr:DUF1992 domain-containing protein [Acidimicrobiia bacterium]
MSEPPKKPANVRWETWVERQIRESMEKGEFDNLPGRGQPLPDLAQPYDELWWLRKKLKDEDLSVDAPALVLRREADEALARIAAAASEADVRRLVAAINDRIAHVNARVSFGPPSDLAVLDVERVVEQWRARATPEGGSAAGSAG